MPSLEGGPRGRRSASSRLVCRLASLAGQQGWFLMDRILCQIAETLSISLSTAVTDNRAAAVAFAVRHAR
jgi:hypothetical protein